jgi:hypothetical protein
MRKLMLVLLAATAVSSSFADEPVDYDMIGKIMDESFNRSQVMDTLYHLTDVIGPRLTNSPGMRAAADWTRSEFEAYGLHNAEFEYFPFGRGWSYDTVTVHMTAPRRRQLSAMPVAWHPGTDGVIEAEAVLASISSKDDFEEYEGKLAGKIVLLGKEREQDEPARPIFTRLDEEQLADIEVFPIPDKPGQESKWAERLDFARDLLDFLEQQGAVAIVKPSPRDAGLLSAQSYLHGVDETPEIPSVVIATEDFDRLVRLDGRDEPIKLSVDVVAEFHDENYDAQNVLAEIPGRGSRPEIVMAGAHLDSWFMGDGAVDNAAGSAVVMEAARILAAIGAKPKRTIRFALWDGEEQGIYGSIYHVEQHFASRPQSIDDEERMQGTRMTWIRDAWPITKQRDYERFSAYFNLDNGSGRIRGIYGQTNPAVEPVFERWLKPFHEMGAATVALRDTGSTDHVPFELMGLPGFQFIQDPLDYGSRLHHTQIDTASHAYEKDLQQAAIIMASFLWHAANRDERLPRMPVPTKP